MSIENDGRSAATMPALCMKCGAVGKTCCQTAVWRRGIADLLARLVERQTSMLLRWRTRTEEAERRLALVLRETDAGAAQVVRELQVQLARANAELARRRA